MRRIFIILVLGLRAVAWGTTYYVSSSLGNDASSGTSASTPWKTLNKVNTVALLPGDSVLFNRGDVWNESLIPGSSGASGNPIRFDAYGTGAPPTFTAAIGPLPGTGWTTVSGTVQKIDLTNFALAAPSITSPTVNFVRVGNLYGRKQPSGGGCSSSIVSKYDWCLLWPSLYVFSTSNNPVAYYGADGAIVPLFSQTSGLSLIVVNGKSWLTFQHIKLQNFDYMGVDVVGASDNLVFANMESDGMVPNGVTPHGFFVSASSTPSNIQFLNDDAHLNYDGFHFSGAATSITLTNCRGYANRDAGLSDGTGHATYTYSHFYGNNVAQLVAGDVVVSGVTQTAPMGTTNLPFTVAPVVTNFNTYPARLSFTVDDVGSSAGTEAYINTFLSAFSSRGLKFNAAVVPSYAVDWASVNSWYGAGNEIDSHSWSHQYYTTQPKPQNTPPTYPDAPAFTVQYTGSGSAATVSFDGTRLTTSVTGAPSDNLSVDLTLSAYDTIGELVNYLKGQAHYTAAYVPAGTMVGSPPLASPAVRDNAHSATLAIVSGRDIKTGAYMMFYDQTRLLPDEMLSAKTAIQANVPGLTETFYVYPDGLEDPTTESDAIAAGYTAARGSLAMKDQNNATAGANSLYANGVNVQNITSLGVMPLHGLSQGQIDSIVASLIFRAAAWGVPYGLFTHYNSRADNTPDISNTELGHMLDSITAHGGTLVTNMALASAITSGTNFSGSTRYIQGATGPAVSMAEGSAASATVGAGTSTGYPVDINGVTRTGWWDIGAGEYIFYSQYGQTGASSGSHFVIGGTGGGSGGNGIPSTFFGLHYTSAMHPQIPFGAHRLWDSGTRWGQLQTASSTYSFTNLDNLLANDKGIGISDVLLTLSDTPTWITSDPTDSSCNYSSSGNGGCGVPTDIAASCTNVNGKYNCDGKTDGTNQTWRNFMYALGTHIAGLNPASYATVSYIGVWNEFTRGTSWEGTNAQMVRLVQDAHCILTGSGTITSNGQTCTAGNMGVAAVGVLPAVEFVTPDAIMLSGNNVTWGAYLATTGALGVADIAAMHAYVIPTASCCAAGETVATRYSDALTQLTAAGGTQPIWSTEGGWGVSTPNLPDLDLQAGFVARYYLVGWSSGYQRLYWYAYNNNAWGTLQVPNGTNGCVETITGQGCLTPAGVAYGQVYQWMVGATMTSPCAVASGTVWTCGLTSPNGTQMLAVWDTAQTCSVGVCTTSTYTPSAQYDSYYTLANNTPVTISGFTVQIGAKPILLATLGGPPNYGISRTDLAIAPVGGVISVPPQMGPNVCTAGNLAACSNLTGVNTCLNDPDFGNMICRMTDANSHPNQNTMQTSDSPLQRIWNCAGTAVCGGTGPTYIALKATGNVKFIYQFNPATMQTSTSGVSLGTGVVISVSWANQLPNRLFTLQGTVVKALDFTPGTLSYTTTTLFDFGGTSCLGNSVNGSGGTYSATWNGVFQQASDDDTFGVVFSNAGGQETGFHYAVYRISTGECWVTNTQTGVITRNGVSIGSVNYSETFTLHEGHITPNPAYGVLYPSSTGCTSGTCGYQYIYSTGSGSTGTVCAPGNKCQGESTSGFAANLDGTGTGNWNDHPYSSFGTYSLLINNPAVIPSVFTCSGTTQHTSWVNNLGGDTLPIFASYGGTCSTFTSAWQKEIIGIPMGGPYGIRFAHNFVTGSNASFDAASGLEQASPDGRFIAFSSDWMTTLGPSGTLTPGTCTPATTCRGDVFVVRVR